MNKANSVHNMMIFSMMAPKGKDRAPELQKLFDDGWHIASWAIMSFSYDSDGYPENNPNGHGIASVFFLIKEEVLH